MTRARILFLLALAPVVLAAAIGQSVPAGAVDPSPTPSPSPSPVPVFRTPVQLPAAAGGTEPRITFDDQGRGWVISNSGGKATVYGSTDAGATWHKVPGALPDQQDATIDTEIVSTRTGRLIATELDFAGVNFRTAYSDDGGGTWTASQGTKFADTDRPFMAVGPDDATTHQPRVYLLWHNLFTGEANHNMYVQTSTDGGASFGPPVPTTLPGSQAFLDLQCADSGGPSDIFVNQTTGRVYAVWGNRGGGAGGCQSALSAPEINIVGATRIYVATSPDGSPGSWTTSLAVDDAASGRLVGMQLSPGAIDNAGNVYVAYTESPNPYPNYDGASLRYVHAPGDLSSWSAPVTVDDPAGGPGDILPHLAVGDPGHIDFAYFHGEPGTSNPLWYATFSQTLDGLDASPTFYTTRLGSSATYGRSASQLMGACGSGPAGPIENGLTCTRSTDVWGVALTPECNFAVTWPSDASQGGSKNATWVTVQTDGPRVCDVRAG